MGDNKGYISREHTMWCGLCCHWDQVAEHYMRSAIKYFRDMGWKKTKENGWVCPKCQRKSPIA